jgi:DNA-binding FadR family transcriptional regulator
VGDLAATAARHSDILEAIEKGDADLLRQAIADHYVPVRERMVRVAAGR